MARRGPSAKLAPAPKSRAKEPKAESHVTAPVVVFPPRMKPRCLGPSKREHEFVSSAPSERVCPSCRGLQPKLSRLEQLELEFNCGAVAPQE